jgi:hypothetical protein
MNKCFYDNIKADQETYEKELSLKKQQLKETIFGQA